MRLCERLGGNRLQVLAARFQGDRVRALHEPNIVVLRAEPCPDDRAHAERLEVRDRVLLAGKQLESLVDRGSRRDGVTVAFQRGLGQRRQGDRLDDLVTLVAGLIARLPHLDSNRGPVLSRQAARAAT